MNNLTAAELLFMQEHLRGTIAGVRFLNHCANETSDIQFKQLCQQFAQTKQGELQQILPILQGAGTAGMTASIQQSVAGGVQVPRLMQ